MKNLIFITLLTITPIFAFSQVYVKSPNGNTGVGVDAPLGKLHVAESTANLIVKAAPVTPTYKLMDVTTGLDGSVRVGAINPSANNFGGAVFQAFSDNAPNHKGRFYFDAGTDASAGVYFRTSTITRMAILQKGRVGIGTASPTEALHVNGNIKYTGTLMSSDKKLKRNIVSYDRGLDALMKITPISYEYNGKGGTIQGDAHVGLIAQELQRVAPELVEEYTHVEMSEATLMEEHKVLSEATYLQIRDNEIKYMLVNAVKEQQEIIEAQDEKIATLEERLAKIEAALNGGIINTNGINQQSIQLDGTGAYLEQNQPNPFNSNTLIRYHVPTDATNAVVNIFDAKGQIIHSERISQMGVGEIQIKAGTVAAGTYSYSLVVDGNVVDTKRMVIAK